jgi:glycosyltransferase involved in cell wall biosynthesis
MRLHLLSIPHTVTTKAFAHCAFTQKVYKLPRMLRPLGYEVVHYGVAGADSGADVDVVLMEQDEHQALLGHPYHAHNRGFYGDDAQADSPLYAQWNLYARDALKEYVQPGDCILLPFGHAHAPAIRDLPVLKAGASAIESGIGYYDCLLPWRIYESEAVRHGVMAKEGRYGVTKESGRLEFVVANSYDVDEWPEGPGGDAIVFLGRLTEGKGIPRIFELAALRPNIPFVLAGQGDPDVFGPAPKNVTFVGSLSTERAAFLGKARAIIAPSGYVEPFCGSVVEAALCGTPAITSAFGAFTETVAQDRTGFRCQTTAEFLAAIDAVRGLDRKVVRSRARRLYGMRSVGKAYDRVFQVVKERTEAGAFPSGGWNP